MKFDARLAALVATGSLGLAGAAQASVNLVVNGNFSLPDPSTYNQSGFNQAVSIPGWTSNTTDTIETGLNSTYGFANYSATVDTNLELNDNTYGSVTQTFTGLVAGKTYQLSWAYGNRAGSGYQELLAQWDGGTLVTEAGGTPGLWFTTGPFNVVATGGSDTLTFTSQNEGGPPALGNELTAVSLIDVPEPTSWALMLVGIGLGGAALRSRRQAETMRLS
jgi:hypothetical protein